MTKGQIKRNRLLSPRRVRQFQRRIFAWHQRHGCPDFPWRRQPTPYRVLVAEVMLQQTQVARVEPKYREFLRRYPTLMTLAKANTAELLRLWSGLGYNRRALLLRECAREVIIRHDGRLPAEVTRLEALPAIGPYTARALAIFAHNADDVCMDTNVRRVLIHELGLPHHIGPRQLETIARQVLPLGRAREWHNALMDYGRLVATSRVTGVKSRGAKSGTFVGSRRYYRGQIMKLLTRRVRAALPTIAREFQIPLSKLRAIIAGLLHDGLVVVVRHKVMLPDSLE